MVVGVPLRPAEEALLKAYPRISTTLWFRRLKWIQVAWQRALLSNIQASRRHPTHTFELVTALKPLISAFRS